MLKKNLNYSQVDIQANYDEMNEFGSEYFPNENYFNEGYLCEQYDLPRVSNKRRRPHSYGGECRRHRVSFADESEEAEELRLLQQGISSYARHNTTHYSSKDILLHYPQQDLDYRQEYWNDIAHISDDYNENAALRESLHMKRAELDTSDGESSTSASDIKSLILCSNDNIDDNLKTPVTTRMVVNSRRKYKVMLPTGNPSIFISVRALENGKEDEKEKEKSRLFSSLPSLSTIEQKSSSELDVEKGSGEHPCPTEIVYYESAKPGFHDKRLFDIKQRHIKIPNKEQENETCEEIQNKNITFFSGSLNGQIDHSSRELEHQEYSIDRKGKSNLGFPHIADMGVKYVETAPTKLVSHLRPLFDINSEKEKNVKEDTKKLSLKHYATVGTFFCPEMNKNVCNSHEVIPYSFYELGKQGWKCKGHDKEQKSQKVSLNLDADIDKLININTTAVVSFGSVQLIF